MPKFVELTAVDTAVERNRSSGFSFAGRTIGEDDLEQPVAAAALPAPEGLYFPIAVFVDDVKEFYPRKGDKPGTRIVYKNGAARPVKETYAEVKAAFASLNN